MIECSDGIARDATLACDICIVGSGAAGIAMALHLMDSGLQVIVLEAGVDRYDEAIQAYYDGEIAQEAMHPPASKYRQRRFGGSTTIWGGACIPFDPQDFEGRPQLGEPGWPIGIDAVSPYYPLANQLLEAGRFDYSAASALPAHCRPMIDGFHVDGVRTDTLERFSCPTDMSVRYRDRLALARSVKVVLDAACIGIDLHKPSGNVRQIRFASSLGGRFAVTARAYVIAAGGIENARLLLASNDVLPCGVGNGNDQVGRYYMSHIAANIGELTVDGPVNRVHHGYDRSPDGIYCRRRITLTAVEQAKRGLYNMFTRLHLPRIPDPSHRNGVLSGLYLGRNLISYEYNRRLSGGPPGSVSLYAAHLRNVVCDPLDTVRFFAHMAWHRKLAERKFPSVVIRNRTNRFSLEVHAEQSPNPDSRIRLSKNRDPSGMPRVLIDWRHRHSDIDSVAGTLDCLAEQFRATGVGRYRYDRDALEADLLRFGAYGGHHIGSTRMGSNPRDSVVDADCRVHDVDNLFMAGSSVFRTSSQATPTLTVVAMALRLADHLRSRASRWSADVGTEQRVATAAARDGPP